MIYEVLVPIAGHARIKVDAGSEEEAIEMALENAVKSDIEDWEAIEQFQEGNVCHCPHPWKVEAEEIYDDEEYE